MSSNLEPLSDFKESSTVTNRCSIPKRYVQALLASLGLFIVYWMRTSLIAAVIHIAFATYEERPSKIDDIDWEIDDIGVIDSTFIWGFVIAQIPGALLTIRFSPHRVFFISVLMATVLHAVLSFSLRSKLPYILIVQFLQGIAEGPLYPACIGIWTTWMPQSEKTRLFSIVLFGSYFGLVVGESLNSTLEDNFGVMSCLYVSSICGLIWCLLWSTQTYESPSNHPHISHYELTYLEQNVVDGNLEVTVKSVPWKSMLTSLPVWAICIANFGCSFNTSVLIIYPFSNYFNQYGHLGYHSILDTLLPIILLVGMILASGFFADILINRKRFSTNVVRKISCSGAFAVQGILFLVIRFYPHLESTRICFNLAHGFLGLSIISSLVNCFDLSPCYASVVMALCQSLGIILPAVLQSTNFLESHEFAKLDFVISLSFVVALAYAFLGSGNIQPWGKPETCSQDLGNELVSNYRPYPEDEDREELVTDRAGHQMP